MSKAKVPTGPIVRSEEAEVSLALGGKAEALAALGQGDFPIPPWIAITPEAFYASLTDAERLGQDGAGSNGFSIVDQLVLGPQERNELKDALRWLCPNGEPVAVRSSAADEDGRARSFAGQLDSFLFVPPEDVARRVVDVWRSGFSHRVLAYRRQHGLQGSPEPPTVLIQCMVNAEVSGVAFSADPVTGRRGVTVVAAVYGLGTALVAGECDADSYRIDRDGIIIERAIADKRVAYRSDPVGAAGVRPDPVPADRATVPALEDAQILAVADLARRSEQHFGRPQDIEWAIADGRLYLLQSRPITGLSELVDPDGVRTIWDNSNIAESYGGTTTPLTFSFVRRAYREVYRQFCRLMRVPSATIARHEPVLSQMLGLIRGRIYYNLPNWYRLLSLFPGFAANRQFMEQMMGVRHALPEGMIREPAAQTPAGRLRDGARLAFTLLGVLTAYVSLPRRIDAFYRRVGQALGDACPDLGRLRADELVAYYRSLESQLLTRWDAPIANDFFAMISYGVLRRLVKNWCHDVHGTLQNDLLSSQRGLISAEPAERVRELARMAALHPGFAQLLRDESTRDIAAAMKELPGFAAGYRAYLDRFGDRCLDELKLESPTLHDDPLVLLRSIGQLAAHAGSANRMSDTNAVKSDPRRRAEARVKAALSRHPVRRLVFRWVLANARARVRDRENLRFERTRVFGRVRAVFLELGRQLYAADLLEAPRDIFYLEVDEILGYVEGTTSCTDLRGLAAVRKAEFDRYRAMAAPPDRFETCGPVYGPNTFCGIGQMVAPSGDQRQGIGCCPGVVRGPVRVINDPRHSDLRGGEIFVAERTDPGWITLFPLAAGLVVEHGSLLSHSAIVARELGIPTVLAVPDATRWLANGDRVELDGGSGLVSRLEHGSGDAPPPA